MRHSFAQFANEWKVMIGKMASVLGYAHDYDPVGCPHLPLLGGMILHITRRVEGLHYGLNPGRSTRLAM